MSEISYRTIPIPGPGGTYIKHGLKGPVLPMAASLGDAVSFRFQLQEGAATVFSETGVGNCLVAFVSLAAAQKLPGGVL